MPPFTPNFVSHKQVEAYLIAAAEFDENGAGKVALKGGAVVAVPPGFASRGAPSEGDMLVRYEPTVEEPDGYLSHSPRAVFEAGYRPLLRLSGAKSFGDALVALKTGHRVCRAGWNGKGMWLVLVPGSKGLTVDEGRPLARAGVPVGTRFDYLPHIDMWTAQGDFVPWLASQTDMLAEDWMVLPVSDRAHDDLGRVA